MLVLLSGLNVLADPMFLGRTSPVQFFACKRAESPGLNINQ